MQLGGDLLRKSKHVHSSSTTTTVDWRKVGNPSCRLRPCRKSGFVPLRSRPWELRQNSVLSAVVEPAQLAGIAAEPVLEVTLLGAVGALCAKQGLLPVSGRRLLSGLVMNVFTPALLFSKLGTSVDVEAAIRLWPLAANMVGCHVVGLALGWLQAVAVKAPANLAPQITVMTAMGNVGNIPLVLIPALISRPGVLELINNSSSGMVDDGGNAVAAGVQGLNIAAASDLGLTYVMLGFFCASFIQFPLGYLLLQRAPDQQGQQQPAMVGAAAPVVPAAAAAAAGLVESSSSSAPLQQALMAQQQELELQQPRPQLQQQPNQRAQVILLGVFTPPVLACLAAVPVASWPELHDALFDPGGDFRFLGDVTNLLGAPLIPCLFLVLGANLADGPGGGQVPQRALVSLLGSKLVLHPLLGLAAVLVARHTGLLPADATDPLMLLVMLLVWATPTAVLTHSLATMLQNGEDQVSYFLFWQYLASLVTLPSFLALYLQLLQSGLLGA